MMRFHPFSFILVAFTLVCPCVLNAQDSARNHAESKVTESKADRDARMAWWREAKFGMFVHRGVYSTTGGLYNGQKLPNSAEWMMARGKIPIAEYGPIGIFWWDTPRKMSRESFDALHSLTSLQPNVISNDRLGEDYPGDYKTFERNLPAQAPTGEDWEVCMPISGSWGYKIGDGAREKNRMAKRCCIYTCTIGPPTASFWCPG